MTSKAGLEVTPACWRTPKAPQPVSACSRCSRCLPVLQEEGQDDQHEGHQLRDHCQTVKKFPYHDEVNVTRPALQFNIWLPVAGRATVIASTVASLNGVANGVDPTNRFSVASSEDSIFKPRIGRARVKPWR